jgi:hypothetical protein
VSQSIPESVVSRVRKLLALAGNNSNENEAQAAAAKAQAILAEYNLEISQIGDAEPSADATREKDVGSVAATADWQVTLMAALAEANFCLHWTTETLARRMDGTGKLRMRRRHSLIGRQVNIIVVKEMYTYLLQAMERLCPYGDRRDRSTRSWYQGCSDRLRSRLQEQRAASEAESRKRRGETPRGSGTDLVLSDVYSSEEDLNNDLRYGYAPGTTAAHRAERDARWAAQRASYEAELAARHSTNPVAPEAKKQESERERLKREARDRRWYESYQRRQAREEAKVDRWAYNQGSSTGRDIGLDRQVEKSKAAQIG